MVSNVDADDFFPGDGGGCGGAGAGVIGGGGVPPGLPPIPFGSVATSPMFIQSVPTPKSTTVSPNGNFLDVSSKDQKMLWQEMVKPANNHVLLDMNVTNSRAIVNLFKDRAITFCWMRFMGIPTSGTRSIAALLARTPGGKDIYSADFSDFKNLIKDFQHITLKQVMAFASWFMGDEYQLRALRAPDDMTMKFIDLNTVGNTGLVTCFKQECRTVSCLVWHTILKSHHHHKLSHSSCP
jgi:hypothetical protein